MRLALAPLLLSLLACAAPDASAPPDAPVTPHCVATGIADPRNLAPEFPAVDAPACAAVPEILRDGGSPSLYLAGDTVGHLRCVGLPPGEATVSFAAEVRLASLRAATPDACWCGNAVNVGLRVERVSGEPIERLAFREIPAPLDRSCRRGPSFRGSWRVPVSSDGTAAVRVVLTECDRFGPSRCLFVAGTRLTIEPPSRR